jgi:DAK2 domain fusion protein YloV
MLPALKEVGVVDSGGYGLMRFFSGMNEKIHGAMATPVKKSPKSPVKKKFIDNFNDDNEGFGYCNEFIMTIGQKVVLGQANKLPFDFSKFKSGLEKLGDSAVVVQDGNLIKVHIHTAYPHTILQYAQQFGEFNKIKVENMTNQFLEKNPGTTLESISLKKKEKEVKISIETKVIATVSSKDLIEIYKNDFNITHVIDTSINGNPSIQEFLDQIKAANSKNIIIVTDDSNVILAAKQAIELNDKVNFELIAAKDAASSYLACLAFNPNGDLYKNAKNMRNEISYIGVGKISKSVKPVKYSHINVKKDDYIGIVSKKIISSNTNFKTVCEQTINATKNEIRKAKEAFLFVGEELTQLELQHVKKYITEKLNLKLEVIESNQPVYKMYIAITQ